MRVELKHSLAAATSGCYILKSKNFAEMNFFEPIIQLLSCIRIN